jgi:hypothetical protein
MAFNHLTHARNENPSDPDTFKQHLLWAALFISMLLMWVPASFAQVQFDDYQPVAATTGNSVTATQFGNSVGNNTLGSPAIGNSGSSTIGQPGTILPGQQVVSGVNSAPLGTPNNSLNNNGNSISPYVTSSNGLAVGNAPNPGIGDSNAPITGSLPIGGEPGIMGNQGTPGNTIYGEPSTPIGPVGPTDTTTTTTY